MPWIAWRGATAFLVLSLAMAEYGSAAGSARADRVDFENDVMPLFTRFGCNAGVCHGAAVGRGGFGLSLYGGNPDADAQAIVRQLEGRRINLAHPEESLLLAKPTLALDHGGGFLFEEDSEAAVLLRDWIAQGAETESSRRQVRVVVKPDRHLGEFLDEPIPLRVTAHYSDGSLADVTRWAVFSVEDPSAVAIDQDEAIARVSRAGRHIVIARYLGHVEPIEFIVPPGKAPIDLSSEPRRNFIDEHLLEMLEMLRIPPSPLADDATFLRRVTLDLTGRLPTPEEVDAFLADPGLSKREERVERLLRSDEFSSYWTLQLAKLFRVRPSGRGPNRELEGATAYHRWLAEQVRDDAGYDTIARSVLLAEGDTHHNGPANFSRTGNGPREQAEFVSELFLGSRLRCANCHDHPLDRWTQDDYHGLAAIFAKVKGGRVIEPDPDGDVIHPATLEPARPRIPGEAFLQDAGGERAALADWLTDRDNPVFSRAIVNRLWARMMGRGLVSPVDDFRSTNPATHPELLNLLAEDFEENGYRLRHTIRLIATSVSYAREATALDANAFDDRFSSHALRRPLEPEVLADAFSDVLGIPEPYGDEPLGTRAVALIDSAVPSRSLEVLERCDRVESCEDEGSTAGGLPQALHLINGPLLNARIGASGGRLDRLIHAGMTPLQIIDAFFVAALGRHLSDKERRFWEDHVDDDRPADEQRALLEDMVWGLLASDEFRTNH
ncbi:DUF1549 and DUF1553 domain-containing protein [Tautonia rosea]|uniref:DUF1549 and DUF1553 domain-containing protein n=1 Tax=Tautonia rosea TaxID=2728037 RepID=UPI0014756B8C|nr:DUF1549 and DUF1553 domain-containing protein [Tautonia rosea]